MLTPSNWVQDREPGSALEPHRLARCAFLLAEMASSFSLWLSSLELRDTKVHESYIQALLGTAAKFCEVASSNWQNVPIPMKYPRAMNLRTSFKRESEYGVHCFLLFASFPRFKAKAT